MKIKTLKFSIIFTFSLPILFFIHTGFMIDSLIRNLQIIFFAVSLAFAIVWPISRRYVFLISLPLIIGMAIFYILDMIYWADILGSTAYGLVILVILSYLPQFIKRGFIEKL